MKRRDTRDLTPRARQIWRALFVLLMLLGATTSALAAGPVTGTYTGRVLGRPVTFSRGGSQVTDWAGVLNLRLDSGQDVPIFCIEVDVLVRSGDRYRSDGPVLALPNGCQIRYLLDNYPASSAKTADEAAARQMAIWAFSDNVDPATITDTTTTVRDRAQALVREARAAPCPGRQPDVLTLTLEPAQASAHAGQPLTYTLDANPDGAGLQVTISVSGTATLEGGQRQGSVTLDGQGRATFRVIGTAAGSSTVSATMPYLLQAGTVFSHIDQANQTQRLVTAERRQLEASASAQASWTLQEAATATARPRPTEEQPAPTETPVISPTELPTVTPAISATEVPTATQVAPSAVAGEQPTPTVGAAAAQPATGAGGVGGAGPPRPRQLPNTGDDRSAPLWPAALMGGLLLAGGVLLRRRLPRA